MLPNTFHSYEADPFSVVEGNQLATARDEARLRELEQWKAEHDAYSEAILEDLKRDVGCLKESHEKNRKRLDSIDVTLAELSTRMTMYVSFAAILGALLGGFIKEILVRYAFKTIGG